MTRCGVGVVDGVPGRRLSLVEVGVIRTPSGDPTPKRLVAIEDEMRSWFERHRPEAVAIERVFADTNVSTVMGTAQVTGIVMMLAERRGLPVALHTPTEVKAAVSGSGRADKAQVTTMVTQLLGLDTPPRPADAADALALAICHVWRGGTQSRLEEARLEQLARTAGRGSGIPRRVPPGAVPARRTASGPNPAIRTPRPTRSNPGAQSR
nr:crossover junction endodeoxyribonuclease RuvC [Terrabacter sp. MAHUQ-38]